ncbi:MAG TPA: DUF1508 domain-containing protein [Burkholderiales bacterium]
MEFRIFRDKTGLWRWHLLGTGGVVLAESADGYANKAECLGCVELFKGASPDTPVVED